jgi:hypothetical protein
MPRPDRLPPGSLPRCRPQLATAPAGSRWSARSAARTNDLEAAKRWHRICRGRKAIPHTPRSGAPMSLFTGKSWDEFLAAGGGVTGSRAGRWRTVQQIKPGDYLLCYLTGVSRWIGVLKVESEAYQDTAPIWRDDEFPCRVNVQPHIVLEPETAIPIHELRDQLTIFRDLRHPNAWTGVRPRFASTLEDI